jgi:hypothetical protein
MKQTRAWNRPVTRCTKWVEATAPPSTRKAGYSVKYTEGGDKVQGDYRAQARWQMAGIVVGRGKIIKYGDTSGKLLCTAENDKKSRKRWTIAEKGGSWL